MKKSNTRIDKILKLTIIGGIVTVGLSVGYYFFMFQPQLAVKSCLVNAKKDFSTAKANTCKGMYEDGQTLYRRCLEKGLSAGFCNVGMDLFPTSSSPICQIPETNYRMIQLQKDYNDAVTLCKDLSTLKL